MAWSTYKNAGMYKNGKKYHNKVTEIDGIVFDSRKEAERYMELRLLERQGVIKDLRRQVPYTLIPEQREESTEWYSRGPRKGQKKPGRVIERPCEYVADFVYREDGAEVVEDTKGMRTRDYIIKRKLMLYVHGIRIREI